MTKDEQIKSLQDSVWQLNYNLNILDSVVADLCCIVPTDTSCLASELMAWQIALKILGKVMIIPTQWIVSISMGVRSE